MVVIYPGADEVGMLLLARAVNKKRRLTPSFKVEFSSVNGPFIITRYEDRPLLEGIKGQINAVYRRSYMLCRLEWRSFAN